MPTVEHDFLVYLFRNRPELARELLALCAGIELAGTQVRDGSIDATQVKSAPFFADFVSVLSGDDGAPVAAIIVEVQRSGDDDDKRWSWPVYVATTRATYRCPVLLLVLAPDPAIARRARRPIETGHPSFTLEPIVIGYDAIPRNTDPHAPAELAVLSALAHPQLDVVDAAGAAIEVLPDDTQRLYWDILFEGLPEIVRDALEATMENYKYRSDFARKYYGAGEQQGLEKGLGQGRIEGLRRAIVTLVGARLPELRDEAERSIAERDETSLIQILVEVGDARDDRQLRAVIDRLAT